MAAGTFLFYAHPFPDQQIFLHVIALRAPHAFLSFKYLYYVLLFTTPYLICSGALSGLYIFTLKARRSISPGRLPQYPDPRTRDELFLVVGEEQLRANPCSKQVLSRDSSPFRNAVCSRGSPSWALLVVARRVAACFRLRNRSWLTKPPTKANVFAV